MKLFYTFCLALAIVSCSKSTESHQHDGHDMEADSTDANTILNSQIMDVHDEVMPKMEDLYTIKKSLEENLKTVKDSALKTDLRARMAEVDSASNLMMDWMHEYNPPDSTVDQEQARAYLEGELEKVKRMKEAINSIIEKYN